jgi:hypothetical protein
MIQNEHSEKVMSGVTKELIALAQKRGYLFVPGFEQEIIFSFKSTQKKCGAPAILLIEHDRHLEITGLLNNAALSEASKIQIAVHFVFAMSPFSLALVNDRRMIASHLTFDAGFQLVEWLVWYLKNPANLIQGEHSERHHDRIEVAKRADGSLRFIQGAAFFGRQQKKAA